MRWYSRAWAWTTSPVLRALGYTFADTSKPISLGADYAAFVPAMSVFDERVSEQASSKFPWLFAGIDCKSGDLASLPWAASLGGYGTRGRPAIGHPLLVIVEQPNTSEPGPLFWRQVLCELYKCGEAYAIKVRNGRGVWTGLLFVPSPRVTPIAGPSGFPVCYQDTSGVQYSARDVIHWRLPGASDDPSRLAGVGYVEVLQQTLDGEYALKARMSAASRQGRPSALATPDTETGILTGDQTKAVREELDIVFRQKSGGIAILGRKLKIDPLDWKPVDLGSDEQLNRSRMEQLAVTRVPPVRLGLETANYATAQQQEEVYWGDTLASDSALIDDALTMHGRLEFGPADLYVYRDFSRVPILQKRRDAALARAKILVDLGADPNEALRSEGIEDVKIVPKPAPAVAPPPTSAAEGPAVEDGAPDEEAANAPMRGGWWDGLGLISRDAGPAVIIRSNEDERAALWRSWRAKLHAPNEIRIRREVQAVLTGQADAAAERLAGLFPKRSRRAREHQRNVIADLVEALFPADAAAWSDVRSRLAAAMADGIAAGTAQVAVSPALDASALDTATDAQLAALVTKTSAATRDDLRRILLSAISDGASVSEMQALIREAHTFSPARALAIARTETTRALGCGTDLAYKGAANTGAKVLVRWLSARLRHTREAHLVLDGQAVRVGEPFVVPSGEYKGQTARFPGDFPLAALVVNCVCTTVAEVE